MDEKTHEIHGIHGIGGLGQDPDWLNNHLYPSIYIYIPVTKDNHNEPSNPTVYSHNTHELTQHIHHQGHALNPSNVRSHWPPCT